MNRRKFLCRMGIAFSAGVMPFGAAASATADPYQALLEVFPDRLRARQIGVACLQQARLGQAAATHRVLLEKLGPLSKLADASVTKRAAAIEAAIQHDFDRGDCVKLDGWVLSKTEAALFALAAMHN